MAKRKFTVETYELAKSEFLSKGNMTQVCRKYGINSTTFTKLLEEDGVYKRKNPTLSEEKIEKIKELRLKGWGAKRIADEVGCNEKTVYRYIESLNIQVNVIKRTNREKNGKYDLNIDFFERIETEEQSYWLGFLFADGSLSKNTITIKLNTDDKHHIEKFSKMIEYEGPIKDKIEDTNFKKQSRNSFIRVCCTDMVRSLNQYMPIGKKSDKIQVPNIKPSLYKHFIRGYFDGDGFVTKGYQRIGFCSNVAFLKSIKKFFIENNLATKEDGYFGNSPGPHYAELTFGKKVSKNVMDWMYKDASIYLERKYNDFYSPGGFKTS